MVDKKEQTVQSEWPMMLDYTKEECKRNLRRIELTAYCTVLSAFRATGPPSEEKNTVLQNIRNIMKISVDRHRAEVRRAAFSENLYTICRHLSGRGHEREWAEEGRSPITIHPRMPSHTSYLPISDALAYKKALENAQLPLPAETARKRTDAPKKDLAQLLASFRKKRRRHSSDATLSACSDDEDDDITRKFSKRLQAEKSQHRKPASGTLADDDGGDGNIWAKQRGANLGVMNRKRQRSRANSQQQLHSAGAKKAFYICQDSRGFRGEGSGEGAVRAKKQRRDTPLTVPRKRSISGTYTPVTSNPSPASSIFEDSNSLPLYKQQMKQMPLANLSTMSGTGHTGESFSTAGSNTYRTSSVAGHKPTLSIQNKAISRPASDYHTIHIPATIGSSSSSLQPPQPPSTLSPTTGADKITHLIVPGSTSNSSSYNSTSSVKAFKSSAASAVGSKPGATSTATSVSTNSSFYLFTTATSTFSTVTSSSVARNSTFYTNSQPLTYSSSQPMQSARVNNIGAALNTTTKATTGGIIRNMPTGTTQSTTSFRIVTSTGKGMPKMDGRSVKQNVIVVQKSGSAGVSKKAVVAAAAADVPGGISRTETYTIQRSREPGSANKMKIFSESGTKPDETVLADIIRASGLMSENAQIVTSVGKTGGKFPETVCEFGGKVPKIVIRGASRPVARGVRSELLKVKSSPLLTPRHPTPRFRAPAANFTPVPSTQLPIKKIKDNFPTKLKVPNSQQLQFSMQSSMPSSLSPGNQMVQPATTVVTAAGGSNSVDLNKMGIPIRIEAPDGLTVTPEEAEALLAQLERLQEKQTTVTTMTTDNGDEKQPDIFSQALASAAIDPYQFGENLDGVSHVDAAKTLSEPSAEIMDMPSNAMIDSPATALADCNSKLVIEEQGI